MGLILDTSVLIADERGKFDMPEFLRTHGEDINITAITASELLHGVERAADPDRKERRRQIVEEIFNRVPIIGFDLPHARAHARIWSELVGKGKIIGPYDLLIAATGIARNDAVATLNVDEFQRVNGLTVIDARPFLKSE